MTKVYLVAFSPEFGYCYYIFGIYTSRDKIPDKCFCGYDYDIEEIELDTEINKTIGYGE